MNNLNINLHDAEEVDYELWLGTFNKRGTFSWKKIKTFKVFETAYKEYKSYVNKQLYYDDKDLIKVWGTGRLDIKLTKGTQQLNWTGIYCRKVDKDADEDEPEE